MRIGIGERTQPDLGQALVCPLPGFAAAELARCAQAEHHVLAHGFPWRKLVEFLEHHDPVWPRPADRMTLQTDLSFARCNETGNRLEQDGFAAARWP